MKTVVIPCAGTGSRLGDLTSNYNKAMITLGPKPVISYIIEHFKKEDEIIIILGYKGNLLKQVIQALYPGWNIKFRTVDVYEGEGSGLGRTLSVAMDLLQKPFIFWPNDTLVNNNFNTFSYRTNWVLAGNKEKDSDSYRHVLVNKCSSTILPKNSTGYSNSFPYTGICFIKDYEKFWNILATNRDLFIEEGEAAGLNNLTELSVEFADNWIDTGNLRELKKAKEEFAAKMEETILEKPNEAIWFIDDRVVKFHIDLKFISDRVQRFNTLLNENQIRNGIKIPKLLYYSDNVYVYQREPGIIASKNINVDEFKELLEAFFDYEKVDNENAYQFCIDFYKNKTLSRITDFCKKNYEVDADFHINGRFCKSAAELVNDIDWDKFAELTVFSKSCHGDFHLENILLQQNGNFVLLDWRQNFGNENRDLGDVYYDVAKMWHSLIVNHNMVKRELFSIKEISSDSVMIDIYRTFLDTEMEKVLLRFIDNKKFKFSHTKLVTALIFLNIAACHVYPYSRFLFYLGKYLLNGVYIEHPNLFKTKA